MKESFIDMRSNLYKNEQIRKIQQNQILHLKGNMRVFCRVKPLFTNEETLISFPQLIH